MSDKQTERVEKHQEMRDFVINEAMPSGYYDALPDDMKKLVDTTIHSCFIWLREENLTRTSEEYYLSGEK